MSHLRLALLTLGATVVLSSPAGAQVEHLGSFATGKNTPFAMAVPGLEEVTAIDASNASAYFLERDGSEWAMGNGEDGELGVGSLANSLTSPVQVQFPVGVEIRSIGEAEGEAAAIDSTGQAWGWGSNVDGSLCIKGEKKITTPVKLPITGVKAVQGGEGHLLWLLDDGEVEGCGRNSDGELGDGDTKASSSPVRALGLEHVVEISAGQKSSCALGEGGEVFTWGGNANGQLGDGTTTNSDVPVHVSLPGSASEVSCGGNLASNGHTLALVGGELVGWGADQYGQVGDEGSANKLSPVRTGRHFERVVASGRSSLGISEGIVFGWGSADGDALGNGHARGTFLEPLSITSPATMISATAEDAVSG